MSILMITHDLGIVAEMADDVAVMYASKVVERAPVAKLFAQPLHPYTVGLFHSRPEPGKSKEEKLTTIPGMVPSPLRFPAGCKFHPRCPYAEDICRTDEPALVEICAGSSGPLPFRRTARLFQNSAATTLDRDTGWPAAGKTARRIAVEPRHPESRPWP